MQFARITARGQTTIPKSIREEADLREGDLLAFDFTGDHLTVRKVVPGRRRLPEGSLRFIERVDFAGRRGRMA